MSAKTYQARVLMLRCEECGHRVGRTGYLKIDRAAISVKNVNGRDIVDIDSGKVYWKILHEACDNDQRKTDFKLPADQFSTTGDLLEATAWLLRNQPELMYGSNWHGLISRVLLDTREFAELLKKTANLRGPENHAARQRLRYAEKKNGSDVITAVLDRDEK
jgi:hypothetical protein